jgi:Ca2+/Na+ antiporter
MNMRFRACLAVSGDADRDRTAGRETFWEAAGAIMVLIAAVCGGILCVERIEQPAARNRQSVKICFFMRISFFFFIYELFAASLSFI